MLGEDEGQRASASRTTHLVGEGGREEATVQAHDWEEGALERPGPINVPDIELEKLGMSGGGSKFEE